MKINVFHPAELVDAWLIWCDRDGLWWRPDGRGYTANPFDAGIYPKAEAFRRASRPIDLVRPLVDYLEASEKSVADVLGVRITVEQWAEVRVHMLGQSAWQSLFAAQGGQRDDGTVAAEAMGLARPLVKDKTRLKLTERGDALVRRLHAIAALVTPGAANHLRGDASKKPSERLHAWMTSRGLIEDKDGVRPTVLGRACLRVLDGRWP